MRTLLILFLGFSSLLLLAEPQSKVVWSEDKNSHAFCTNTSKPECYLVCEEQLVNVSQVINSNLGKLGTSRRNEYEKVITFPTRWIDHKSEQGCMFEFKTQAWKQEKRYSVYELVYVEGGTFHSR